MLIFNFKKQCGKIDSPYLGVDAIAIVYNIMLFLGYTDSREDLRASLRLLVSHIAWGTKIIVSF